MLQRLRIENFIRIPYLDLEIRHPVLLVAGPNEAGKTTIAEAIRFVMRGDSPRVNLKKLYPMLVTNGAKRGTVELTFDNMSVKRNVKDGAATGDTDRLPTDPVVADICLGAARFVDLEEKERRTLVMRLFGVALTGEKITAELKQRGFSDHIIERYEPMYASGGLNSAFDKADRIAKEGRGEWKGVTGEVYGPEKAEGWKSPAAGIPIAELEESIATLDAELVELQTARDDELAPVLLKVQELNTSIERPAGTPCPECTTYLVYSGGVLTKATALPEQSRKMAEASRVIQWKKRDDIRDAHNLKVIEKQTDRAALAAQIQAERGRADKEKLAGDLHEEIKAAEELRKLFGDGPDGIMGRFVAKAIEPFNTRVAELATDFGWQTASLGGDMEIQRADHCAYRLLSESAQWRIDRLFQIAIAEYGEFKWLIFDRLDVLEPSARVPVMKWADAYAYLPDEDGNAFDGTIVVLGTLKQRPDLSSLKAVQVEWIEGGEIAIVDARGGVKS